MNPINFKNSMAIIYAPIAGVSDSPSRKLARSFGADITVSELVSSEGIIRNGRKTLELVRFDDSERPFGIQIFGANPHSMAEAAKTMERLNPDFIDINFGCPARKVVGKNGGSSILRNLKLLQEIVENIVKAVNLPVTVKMRSGWDDNSLIYLEAGRIIEGCGANAITLHPRNKAQGFNGKADWSQILELKEAVNIAVIGNGDIFTPPDAIKMFEQTGCDAVMIGRGSLGNPWIFQRIKQLRQSNTLPPEPTLRQKIETALNHFDMTVAHYGLPNGIFIMRSRFGWYLKGLPGASKIRSVLNKLESPSEIKDLLNGLIYEYTDSRDADNTKANQLSIVDKT